MSNCYNSIGVILEKDIQDDDAECVLNAIKMIKGVLSCEPNVTDFQSIVAEVRVRNNIANKLREVLL